MLYCIWSLMMYETSVLRRLCRKVVFSSDSKWDGTMSMFPPCSSNEFRAIRSKYSKKP